MFDFPVSMARCVLARQLDGGFGRGRLGQLAKTCGGACRARSGPRRGGHRRASCGPCRVDPHWRAPMPPHQRGGRLSLHPRRRAPRGRRRRARTRRARLLHGRSGTLTRTLHRCRSDRAWALQHRRAECARRDGRAELARKNVEVVHGQKDGPAQTMGYAERRSCWSARLRYNSRCERFRCDNLQAAPEAVGAGGTVGDSRRDQTEGLAVEVNQANLRVAAHYDASANIAGRRRLQDFEVGCDFFDAVVRRVDSAGVVEATR